MSQPPVKLSHIAIACSQISAVAEKLAAIGLEIENTHLVESEKVNAAMLPVAVSEDLRIELLEPTAPTSAIHKFLEKKPSGGLHHLAFEVVDLPAWETKLRAMGLEILPPGVRTAARGRALFIHPRSMGGVLVELEEITKG